MKGKHAQKNFGAIGAMAPTPLSLKTGGGWGVSHTRTAPPPPVCLTEYDGTKEVIERGFWSQQR